MTPVPCGDPVNDHEMTKFIAAAAAADRCIDDLLQNDPAASAELRRLLVEGLESGVEGEVNDEWWQSLAEGVQKRTLARRR